MKRRFLASLSAVVAALVLLAGCAGSKPAETPPATSSPTPSTSAPSPTPAAPKVLTIAGGTDVQSLDIHKVSDSPSFSALEHVNETLFHITADGQLKPHLAETYTVSDDGLVATVKLRSGIKFTDGTPFNADAVKQNLDRVLDPNFGAAFSFLLGQVKEVQVKDELTVELLLETPFAPLQYHLGHGGTGIVSPAHLAKGDEAVATHTVGTGPFMVKEWKKGEQLELVRNDSYWGTKAQLDGIVFKMVKDDGPRMVEIESGNADVAVRVPPSEITRLQANPDLDIVVTPGLRTIFIYMNNTKPPFDDVRVRQAINYAVDKDAIVKAILNDMGRVSDSPIAPNIFGYTPQQVYKADKDRAKQLLKDAGYENGLQIELLHPDGRYPQDARVAEAVRAQLKEVGIDVTLTTMEWAQYIPHTGKPKEENTVQMAMLGWSTPTMDADYGLFSLFHSSVQAPVGYNRGFYDSPETDQLLMTGRTATNNASRTKAYADATKQIWEDAPWLFLYSEIQVTAIRKNVSGFVIHPSERLIATGTDKTSK